MILNNNHPFLTSAQAMKEITSPLSSLGISYFGYSRHYVDGGRIWLTNTPENLENYYANKEYRIGNSEANPKSYQSQVVLWSTLPNQKVYESSRQLGIDHGIFIVQPQENYCEFIAYATTPDNHSIINTYLTRLDLLKKFANYFKDKASTIITHAEKNKIFLPYHNVSIQSANNLDLWQDIDGKSKQKKLSKQQAICAQLLLKGRTNKEIAKHLALSPRTIETYINNLKHKFNCNNRIELIVQLSSLNVLYCSHL